MVHCQIVLTKPLNTVYKPGDCVEGIVKLIATKHTEYKKIVISLIGKGKTYWTETFDDLLSPVRKHWEGSKIYEGKDEFLTQHLFLLNVDGGAKMKPGLYEHPFMFILPLNIPTTYQDKYCKIRYKLQLMLSKDRIFSIDKKSETEIFVHGYVRAPGEKVKFNVSKTPSTSILSNSSDNGRRIQVEGETNAIVQPGTDIDITFNVTNGTDVNVKGIKVELVCDKSYRSTYDGMVNNGRSKDKSKVLTVTSLEIMGIPANSALNMRGTLPTSKEFITIQNSDVFSQDYKLKVTLKLPMPHGNEETLVPIMFGTKHTPVADPSHAQVQAQATAVDSTDPPPSYKEVMGETSGK